MICVGFIIICFVFAMLGGVVAGEIGLIGGAIFGALAMIFAILYDINRNLESQSERS